MVLGYQEVRPSGAQAWPASLLEHEPPDAGAGVHGRQDEERLEHDGEVIPERGEVGAERSGKDLRHPDAASKNILFCALSMHLKY